MTLYYEDDLVTLYHGDCLQIGEWLDADVLVTDPPYGIAWKQGNHRKAHRMAHPGIQNDDSVDVRDAVLRRFGDKPALAFGVPNAPQPAEVKQVLVWRKPVDAGVVTCTTGFRRDVEFVYVMGKWPRVGARWSSVLETNGSIHNYLTGHPHAKPTAMLERLIVACPPGVIADPFAGSGSTLVAAVNQGRKAIGVELEERYCELIAKRLSNQTAALF